MKFGIIGMGYIFPRHVEAIQKNGGKIFVCCDRLQNRERLKPEGSVFVTDWRQMLDMNIDYVSILTPNHLHFMMAREFAAKGIKVIVEKPPDLREAGLKFLDREYGDMVFPIVQLRYHPILKEIKDFLIDNEGAPVEIRVKVCRDATYWSGWKGDKNESGGILFNIGIHYLDILRVLFGEVEDWDHWRRINQKKAFGMLGFKNFEVMYNFEIMSTPDGQTRELVVDGRTFQFSEKGNLSEENLHTVAYREILQGRGIMLNDIAKTVKLIENLYEL